MYSLGDSKELYCRAVTITGTDITTLHPELRISNLTGVTGVKIEMWRGAHLPFN